MTDELDPTGAAVDSTKIVTVVAGVTALVTVVLNWLRGRREGQEKAEALMIERYKTMVADMTKAADAVKAEHTAYRAETARQIDDLREKIAELVSQVHYLQLYLAQSGVKTPPKWDPRDDSALFPPLREDPKESK